MSLCSVTRGVVDGRCDGGWDGCVGGELDLAERVEGRGVVLYSEDNGQSWTVGEVAKFGVGWV